MIPEDVYDDNDLKNLPLLIMIPGLTGERNDLYILNTIEEAIEEGYQCVLVNHRGAVDTMVTTPVLYTAG